MITSYKCNEENALREMSNNIRHTGKYIGTISQCEVGESQGGATFIEFAFVTSRYTEKVGEVVKNEVKGTKVDFIRTYITDREGKPIFSTFILDQTMSILGVKEAPIMPSTVFNRDKTRREGYRMPDIEKKEIGYLIEAFYEPYTDSNGMERQATRLRIISAFDPKTGKTAEEKANGKDANAIDTKLNSLKDGLVREARGNGNSNQGWQGNAKPVQATTYGATAVKHKEPVPQPEPFEGMTEDVPF